MRAKALPQLEQVAIRYGLLNVLGWEGPEPDKTMVNMHVLQGVLQHVATVLDDANAAGALPTEDLRLFSEFLSEPSRSTFLALASVVPQSSRTFKPPRGLFPSKSRSDRHVNSHIDPDVVPTPAEVREFIRRHLERCAAVMLTRCAPSFAPELWADRAKITPSRLHRYEKWFEGLPSVYRSAILRVGSAAGESDRGSPSVLAVVGDFIAGPESLRVVEQALSQSTA